MRRFLFGVVIASVTATVPSMALGGDREIAKTVMTELQQYKEAGQLKGFDINLKVENGVVFLTGEVATKEQRSLIAQAANSAVGSQKVVNDVKVRGSDEQTAQPVRTQEVQAAASYDLSPAPSNQDSTTTDAIYDALAQAKAAGALRGFDLDISTVAGDVWVRGYVSTDEQKAMVIDAARRAPGVVRVIDDVTVVSSGAIRQVSTEIPTPVAATPIAATPAPMPVPPALVMPQSAAVPQHITVSQNVGPQPVPAPQAASMPTMGYAPAQMPQPMVAANMASHPVHGQAVGAPVPMHYAGAEYGMGAPRYDQPSLPNYAWPTYAAYPNYAAVTYPKQYSPSAWPYIGPFYPYPQVPLGWRKVTLQWDDGLWHLDFTGK